MTGKVRVPPADVQSAGGGVHVGGHGAAGESAGVPAGTVQLDALETQPDALETQLDALRAQLDERTADLQRVSAEYSNYRRRVERDRQLVVALAKAQVAGGLLTVLDDIERAQEHGDLSGAFKVVADKLVAGLQAHGLESFGTIGDGFDPDVHEAVHHSTAPDVHGPTVTAVLRRGYRFGERVLRPAMVAVTDAEPAVAMSRDAAPSEGAGPSREAGPSGDAGPFGDADPGGGAEQLQDN